MTDTPPKRDHLLSNQFYDILHIFALIIFPALGTAYFALADIWGLPAAQQVLGTIVVIDTFLGVLVKVGQASYNSSNSRFDGTMRVLETPEKKTFTLELNTPVEDLDKTDTVTFKVAPSQKTP